MVVLTLAMFVLQTPTGYLPYSNLPAMGWTAPVYNPAGLIPGSSNYSIEATVTDKDKYKLSADPGTIEEFGNAQTTIVPSLTSGAVQSTSDSFDSPTGKHSFTFSCYSIVVPHDTQVVCYDTFDYKDTGSGVVSDGHYPQTKRVVVTGVYTSGG